VPDEPPILEFESVTTEPGQWPAGDLVDCTLSLAAGELALVRFDPRDGVGPIPDVASGMVEPARGAVRFRGKDWADMRPAGAARRRGRIGRYFGRHGWVNHLDVDENVTLRERHHTHRPLAEIHAEADALARALGLPDGLPTLRPGQTDPRELQRAACVRMLLGSPPLILFDEPPAGLPTALVDAVLAQLRRARGRGAAVLWLTADPLVWQNRAVEPTWTWDRTDRDGRTAAAPQGVTDGQAV
jgi:phospholipid/cholesterol/gamma-HCH transport system ATP-binding protein